MLEAHYDRAAFGIAALLPGGKGGLLLLVQWWLYKLGKFNKLRRYVLFKAPQTLQQALAAHLPEMPVKKANHFCR